MSDFSLSEINDKISKSSSFIDDLKKGMNQVILGQDELISKIIISILSIGSIFLKLKKFFILETLSF